MIFILGCEKEDPPTLRTLEVTDITGNSAKSGGNITDDGGETVTARGVVWSTAENPSLDAGKHDGFTEDGEGTGTFISELTGLGRGTTYYVRAYATNSVGTAYGGQVEFDTVTEEVFACGDDVSFTYRGEEVTYGTVVNTTTGKCWMDRNLGASQVAASSTDSDAYGDLFQWGRLDDGHQDRGSETTETISSTDAPGHGDFILAPYPFNWHGWHNPNLWQGDGSINDVCPAGWRVPTETELNDERLSWSSYNSAGAFASPLKLPMAGGRHSISGSLEFVGSSGFYWSSDVAGLNSRYLEFDSNYADMNDFHRALGLSVRCIKD